MLYHNIQTLYFDVNDVVIFSLLKGVELVGKEF